MLLLATIFLINPFVFSFKPCHLSSPSRGCLSVTKMHSTHSHAPTRTEPLLLSLSLTHTHSLTRPHTHTHTHKPTHTPTPRHTHTHQFILFSRQPSEQFSFQALFSPQKSHQSYFLANQEISFKGLVVRSSGCKSNSGLRGLRFEPFWEMIRLRTRLSNGSKKPKRFFFFCKLIRFSFEQIRRFEQKPQLLKVIFKTS